MTQTFVLLLEHLNRLLQLKQSLILVLFYRARSIILMVKLPNFLNQVVTVVSLCILYLRTAAQTPPHVSSTSQTTTCLNGIA